MEKYDKLFILMMSASFKDIFQKNFKFQKKTFMKYAIAI